jgi:hypothetical protein
MTHDCSHKCVHVCACIADIDIDYGLAQESTRPAAQVLNRRDEESSNVIQRVANDFNQLKFYVSRGKHLPLVQSLSHVRALLRSSLDQSSPLT